MPVFHLPYLSSILLIYPWVPGTLSLTHALAGRGECAVLCCAVLWCPELIPFYYSKIYIKLFCAKVVCWIINKGWMIPCIFTIIVCWRVGGGGGWVEESILVLCVWCSIQSICQVPIICFSRRTEFLVTEKQIFIHIRLPLSKPCQEYTYMYTFRTLRVWYLWHAGTYGRPADHPHHLCQSVSTFCRAFG